MTKKVKVNKQTLVWMYEQGFTAKQMLDYLNENYGAVDVVFTARHVNHLYNTLGMDLRKKPRPRFSFQIQITEDEDPVEEPVESADEVPEEDPYFIENLEEIPNLRVTEEF